MYSNEYRLYMTQRLDFNVDVINLGMLDRAKPKGRTIKNTEERILKLGAKGEKRRIGDASYLELQMDTTAGLVCLWKRIYRARLATLANQKRGRPSGSRINSKTTVPQWNETSTTKNIVWLKKKKTMNQLVNRWVWVKN
jgi:hypothetical protein